jgi:uncharacterized membrane protein
VRGVPFPGFYFWLKLRKSSADSSYTGRERRFLRDPFDLRKTTLLCCVSGFALVVLLGFDLVRARVDEDLALVRFAFFFIIHLSMLMMGYNSATALSL